jgi:hypothetical protein
VRALLARPERAAALGRAGTRRARRLYDFDRIGAATRDVYAEAVRAREAEAPRRRFERRGARVGRPA